MTRRDNGLPGQDWRRLADLAPPVADHVLEVLRDEGIAAQAAPATANGPYGETRPHPRPLDQVFVPATELDEARAVLDRLLPTLTSELEQAREDRVGAGRTANVSTDDDVWAGIVAAYSAPPADPVGRWPAAEDRPTGDDAVESAEVGDPLGADAPAPVDDTREAGAATGFDDIRAELDSMRAANAGATGPADDPTDHYVPPPPPPLPEGDPVTRAAWVALIGGPLWFILATAFGWGSGGLTGFVAVIAFVGGFVTLVTRMRDDRDDDGDDGAVV